MEMSRQKVSSETILTERGPKIKVWSNEATGKKKNGAKRKPRQENEMWREEKRRRSQEKEMPKDKDAERKCREWGSEVKAEKNRALKD